MHIKLSSKYYVLSTRKGFLVCAQIVDKFVEKLWKAVVDMWRDVCYLKINVGCGGAAYQQNPGYALFVHILIPTKPPGYQRIKNPNLNQAEK